MSRPHACFLIVAALLLAQPAWAAPAGEAPGADKTSGEEALPEGVVARIGRPRLRHGGASVICVAFAPDGKTLASVGNDNLGRLWDPATGRQLRPLQGHTGPVESVAFGPDGKTLVTASYDRTLRLWDTATGKEIRQFTGHQGTILAVAFSH